MKKMFAMLAAMLFAGAGAVEFYVPAKEMNFESSEWGCDRNANIIVSIKGKAVAQGTYAAPAAGKYTIWVYTETRNEGWRKAQIKLNDVSYGKFGDEKVKGFTQPKWYWKKMLLPFEIKAAGEIIKVQILDCGKGSARFGGVIFTDNPAFDPTKAEGNVREEVDALENAE